MHLNNAEVISHSLEMILLNMPFLSLLETLLIEKTCAAILIVPSAN
jgi:hypothetical protein